MERLQVSHPLDAELEGEYSSARGVWLETDTFLRVSWT